MIPRIAIICDLVEEGWPSMDLVGEMLLQQLKLSHAGAVEVTRVCPAMRRRLSRAVPAWRFNADRFLNRFWDYPKFVRRLRNDFDLFHLVDHSYGQLVHELPAERTIVTCHDLDTFKCLLQPEQEPRSIFFKTMMKRTLSGLCKATLVSCDSFATRDGLLSHGLFSPERTIVAPLGVHPSCSPEPNEIADAEAERLLGRRPRALGEEGSGKSKEGRAEGEEQTAEGRGQKAEVRSQKSEVRGQQAEGRGQVSEVGSQEAEGEAPLTLGTLPLALESLPLGTLPLAPESLPLTCLPLALDTWPLDHGSWRFLRESPNPVSSSSTTSHSKASAAIHSPSANGTAPLPLTPSPSALSSSPLAHLPLRLPPAPLLLHVGSVIPRKRIDVLLRVFVEVRKRFPHARLVRVGGEFTSDQNSLINELGTQDPTAQDSVPLRESIVVLPRLERDVLAAVYRRAALVLLTSEAEGFGLPVVEALACGTPVVSSDLPVLREVGGNIASYCPVADIDSWTSTIIDLLCERAEQPEAWDERRQRSIAQAGKFSWAEYANTMVGIYQDVLSASINSLTQRATLRGISNDLVGEKRY
jgi:glycosyltransferase involved in cell wall biosynthesis